MISDKRIMEAARRSMESSASSTHEQLKRGLNALATIGATAPFVGLFGTVIGIMNSFRGTTTVNLTHFSSVSGGISAPLRIVAKKPGGVANTRTRAILIDAIRRCATVYEQVGNEFDNRLLA